MKQDGFSWRSYWRKFAWADGMAAVIVTVMLIPQSLAYAFLAGLPPVHGLYASLLPLLLYAVWGSSHALSVGPVAVIALMTASAIGKASTLGLSATEAALILALLSGMILLILGILKAGFLANLLSHPVVSGFIAASALLIALSQVQHILNVPIPADAVHFLPQLWALLMAIPQAHLLSSVMGLSVIAFLWWSRQGIARLLHRYGVPNAWIVPLVKIAPVVAVILTTVLTAHFHWETQGLKITGPIPAGLPPLTLPTWQPTAWQTLLLPAALMALIGYVESIAVARTLATQARKRIAPNRELVALGMANIGAALTAGMPVTGGFSRSVVNNDAGAQTKMAGIFAAIGMLLATLFLTPILFYLPKVTLAATIIVAVMRLFDLSVFRHAWHYDHNDFLTILLTFTLTLLAGVEWGVLIGVLLSLALHLFKTARPHIAEIGLLPNTETFRNVQRHNVITDDRLLSLRPDENLCFLNADQLAEHIMRAVAQRPTLKHVIIQCYAVNHIDLSALEILTELNTNLAKHNIALHLSDLKGPVADRLTHNGWLATLNGNVFRTHFDAWQHLRTPTQLSEQQ